MKFRTGTFVGALAMVAVWGVLWALPGGVIEAIDNVAPSAHSFTRQIDMWPQTLGLPGLMAGLVFTVLLLMTQGRRGFGELSLVATGALGAVSGLLVGVLVVWGIELGLSDPWQLGVTLAGLATVLGALAGVGSTLLFRYLAQRRAAATA